MVLYICDKCNKEYINKNDYNRHLNRKFSCDNIPPTECKYCHLNYSNKQNLTRHLLTCTARKKIDDKKTNQNVLNINAPNNTTTQNNAGRDINNTTNNITNNNITNNNKVNVVITPYGKETYLDTLSDDMYMELIYKGLSSIRKAYKRTHFNKNRPEDSNIYISNKRSKNVIMFINGIWTEEKQDAILSTAITEITNILEEKNDMFKNKKDRQARRANNSKRYSTKKAQGFETYLRFYNGEKRNDTKSVEEMNYIKDDIIALLCERKHAAIRNHRRWYIEQTSIK